MKESEICELCTALSYIVAVTILLINWMYGGEYEYLLDYVSIALILGTVFLVGKMILSKVEYIYTVVWGVVTFILMMTDGKVDDSNEEK